MYMGTATIQHGITPGRDPGAARLPGTAPQRTRWAHNGGDETHRPSQTQTPAHQPFKPPPAAPSTKEFAPQDQVTHDKDGLGRVLEVEPGRAVLVDFGTQKVKILAPFTRLFRL